MTNITQNKSVSKALEREQSEPYAIRLRAIRTELNSMRATPYRYGRHGPHRKQRDESILCDFAADAWARLIDAAS